MFKKNLRVIKSRTKRRIFRKKMSKYVETGPIYVHYVNMRASASAIVNCNIFQNHTIIKNEIYSNANQFL